MRILYITGYSRQGAGGALELLDIYHRLRCAVRQEVLSSFPQTAPARVASFDMARAQVRGHPCAHGARESSRPGFFWE